MSMMYLCVAGETTHLVELLHAASKPRTHVFLHRKVCLQRSVEMCVYINQSITLIQWFIYTSTSL